MSESKNTFKFIAYLFIIAFATPGYAGEPFHVAFRGAPLTLQGNPVSLGKPLSNIALPDSSMNMTTLDSFKGKVTILSVVPSIDTATCEKQTHILSENNEGLDTVANLVTISRDLPFAQKRFTQKSRIANLIYLSDYRDGIFGMETGLMIEQNRLLARAVIVLDQEGIVRYLEVVSDLAKLPQMKKAFEFARSLL